MLNYLPEDVAGETLDANSAKCLIQKLPRMGSRRKIDSKLVYGANFNTVETEGWLSRLQKSQKRVGSPHRYKEQRDRPTS